MYLYIFKAEYYALAPLEGITIMSKLLRVRSTHALSFAIILIVLLCQPLSLVAESSPDFDSDGTVGIPDFLFFVDLFGSKEGEERYDARYDLDGDGEIGIGDFLIFVDSFGQAVNRVPIFTSEPPVTRSVDENTPSGQPIGEPIAATDGDGDILTYRLSGADADNFAIDASTGQISTQGTYDFEQKSSYTVTVIVSDGEGGEASLVVNITINNIEEPSATVPSNVVVEEDDSKLTVRWDAVSDEEGKPPVIGYEVGYRERDAEDSDKWTGIQKVSSQLDSLIITGLLNGQAYLVSVRTLVDGGMSEWSSPVLGIPVIPAAGPVFIGGGGGGGGGTPPPPVVINDNDPPQVTISAGTTPVTEGTSATFTITATSAPATALTVNVNVSETGEVISGTPSSTVTIDADETTATLTVNTVNDQGDEPNSVVTAQVESGTGYTVGSSSSASVTVEDNDIPPVGTPEVTISAGTTPVTEGTAATFTITADPAPATALTVIVNVSETGEVISGTPSSTVTIDADETTATLTVNTVNDQGDEPNSVVTAQVESGTGYTVGSSSSASVTVEDNDIPPVGTPEVTISAGTTPVTEGTAATFTITADPAPATALTVIVNVSENGDVITTGSPYFIFVTTIEANETTVTLTVYTSDDQADEPNSVITAEVKTGTGYTVGSTSSASVTINDNDVPQITISAGTSPVTEGTAATFTITATAFSAPTSALTVNVDVSEDGNVISGTAPSTVTINANATTATLTVATDNDEADEAASKVTAEVESGTGYTVGSTSSASVTVEDNDILPPGTPEVTISAGTTPVTEGTSATFTITASPAPTSLLTVSVNVSENGDVISGTPSSTVTINADETTATLTVTTDDDQVDEFNSVITAEVETTGHRLYSGQFILCERGH